MSSFSPRILIRFFLRQRNTGICLVSVGGQNFDNKAEFTSSYGLLSLDIFVTRTVATTLCQELSIRFLQQGTRGTKSSGISGVNSRSRCIVDLGGQLQSSRLVWNESCYSINSILNTGNIINMGEKS